MGKNKKIVTFIVLLIVVTIFFFMFNPATSGFFFSCPFKTITRFECPGCGSQRAIHQLLHGNVTSAFYLNPLMVLTLPILFYGLGIQGYNFIYNKKVRFSLFYSKWFIFGYFILAFLFGVIRNTAIYPY